MPRDGSGAGDNAEELGETKVHGAGGETGSKVDRSDKAAPMPSEEKGDSIEGMNASGGGNKITDSGKGESKVHKDNE
ncbi:hypothetical protein B0A48_12901 [Cryoendolithus antarcticus]|uniref:Uncharacterized protein n=1 Tax=Cryoendolithus antarcticus TaxID=1507870 RepID=A0A1V8SQA4_9PEZI|nr:hypothetical protein B0A48_12901 [Cryoendolithus antarcticus]OQO24039.1 hypothetical protein B0A51_06348 [Rachicladosporium sp. CCFEE 5018]OQO28769.1 hypothetical protein B0A51_02538 [Rachicladosporium sp. CCFEE 5018]OQO32464.1 hypothetical protein B0A51_00253 [Rachicladosporium sp. CCFEE 5018]